MNVELMPLPTMTQAQQRLSRDRDTSAPLSFCVIYRLFTLSNSYSRIHPKRVGHDWVKAMLNFGSIMLAFRAFWRDV